MPLLQRLSRPLILVGILLLWAVPVRGQEVPVLTPVQAENGMAVSARVEASEAGVAMLKQGGNAIDAAVATGFALAVVYPRAGNIGGGGFMVIRQADGSETTIDYREKAPMEASRTMYQDDDGEVVSSRSRRGYLASGVPGSVAGLLKALEQYGTLSRAQVMAPAIRLAEEGFPLSARQANDFNALYDTFAAFPGSKRYFTKGDSTRYFEAGERFVQADLAAVLKRIRDEGRAGFYDGETADLLVAEMERGGGLLSHADLQDYAAVERPPVRTDYRGYNVISMGPPSSGGVALAQLFNAVEPYDISGMGYQSSEATHLMGEAMRRVFADRARWLGDSDFFDVPLAGLTDPAYMQARMQSFTPRRVMSSDSIAHGQPMAYESMETTHYSIVDSAGNAVSVTTTLNGSFGSKVVVDGAGFFLNNEMDDFSAKPGVPNMYGLVGSEANAIEPEKRMLSSMSPTIVEDPRGRAVHGDRHAGRLHDYHDGVSGDSERGRSRHEHPGGRGRAAHPSPVEAGRDVVRALRAGRRRHPQLGAAGVEAAPRRNVGQPHLGPRRWHHRPPRARGPRRYRHEARLLRRRRPPRQRQGRGVLRRL